MNLAHYVAHDNKHEKEEENGKINSRLFEDR